MFALLRLFFKKSYSLKYYFSSLKNSKKTKFFTLAMFLFIPSFVSIIYVYTYILNTMYDVFFSMNQESFYLALIYLFVFMAVLVFGLFHAISGLCFSDDINMFLHLPIKKNNILLAKYLEISIIEYLFALFIYIPGVIVFGINADMGFLYYFISFISFFLVPVLPMVIACVIAIIINRFANLSNKQEMYRTISTFVILIIIIGIQVISFRTASTFDESMVNNLINDNMFLMESVSKYNIFAKLFVDSLYDINIFKLILLIVLSIAIIFVFISFFSKMYFRSLMYRKGGVKANKAVNFDDVTFSGNIYNVFIKDFKIMLRTSAYFINILSIPIIVPVIFGVFIVSGMYDGLIAVIDQLSVDTLEKYFNFGYIALAVFMVGATPVTSTSLSREGKSIWLTQTMPIEPKDQILGRMIIAIIVNVLFIITTLIPVSLALGLFCFHTLWLAVNTFIISLPIMLSGLLIDVYKPMISWKSPTVAVKQNLNVLFNMVFAIFEIVLFFLIFRLFGFSYVALTLCSLLSIVFTVIIYKVIEKVFLLRLSDIK